MNRRSFLRAVFVASAMTMSRYTLAGQASIVVDGDEFVELLRALDQQLTELILAQNDFVDGMFLGLVEDMKQCIHEDVSEYAAKKIFQEVANPQISI